MCFNDIRGNKDMKKLFSALLVALLCAALMVSAALAAQAGIGGERELPLKAEAAQEAAVKVSTANFPDAALRKYVSDNFDKDKNGSLSESEIKAATTLNLTNSGVKNLKGIALFPYLKVLKANYLAISKADVSGNPALEELELTYTGVSKVDLKNNKNLKRFWISGSNFTSVDLRDCPDLEWFSCAYSSVSSIDLSNSKKLKTLYCYESNLKSLNVSKCAALQVLACSGNPISSLNVTGCPALRILNIDHTGISGLNLSKNTNLEQLTASQSALTALDLSKNTKLVYLTLRNCSLTSLTLGSKPALTHIFAAENRLTSLDASQCPKLGVLNVPDNALTSLTLPKTKTLGSITCNNNALTQLNVKNCPGLNFLFVSDNRLTKLDLTANKQLRDLEAARNCMGALDLSKNTALTHWDVSDNVRQMTAEAGRIFFADLGVTSSKVMSVEGAQKVSGAFVVSKSGSFTYRYDMGGGREETFKVKATYKKGQIASVTIAKDKYAFTGKAVKPKVTVKAKISGRTVTLVKGTHYKVYYKNNLDTGTATITVKGTGHYQGTLTKTFKITKVKLASLTLSSTTMAYTGKALKPKVTVKAKVDGSTKTLIKGEDYTVKYENNVKKGTAKVTVTGIGNYTGTLTKTFTIK